ncbi:wax ester/triacylglycerol synthase family O-acyltransferase [Gordonia amicalis]|uniref:wax ester/triacylglycerol synthase domain-containing protein n=1 Tax=Gordonia amicalis TaxID=89053 RepID=UPI0022A75578|nr:wax ester/triacylglycerol synthase domain-containing protein [Gordonia amicalis]MCZ0914350.1 WS/DGAT domain-containing protein [Gordonia amicalis]MDV7175193.1 wax ester/triacylglycerol synthase family O-acyltransferase [Gordonia amicalis]
MVNRLSPRDAMYYFLDDARSTTHLGALLVIDPCAGEGTKAGDTATGENASASASVSRRPAIDYQSLVSLVENRLQRAPRYRQVVREVTLGLARPVWVDDRDFDINFHIRRSGLPRPGGPTDLAELISRVMSRPLDRTRPLWEMYLIEGLADGRLAILTKSHRCLIDGPEHPEISEVICDDTDTPESLPEELWMPGSPPGTTSLVIGALAEAMARPGDLVETMVHGNGLVSEVRSAVGNTVRRFGDVVGQLTDSAPRSPLNNSGTTTRTFTTASVPRRDCAKIAEHHNCTVTDVELAIISGVMRRWMLSVDPATVPADTVRVVIPLSTRDPGVEVEAESEPGWISVGKPSFVTDLPVGESNPTVRLAQVAGLADRYAQSSRRMSTGPSPLFPELGMVPFADISSRAFRSLDSRSYNVPVAMSTAPVADRFVLGVPVREVFYIPVLVSPRALAVSVVEYGDRLQFAFMADRGVIRDLPDMADYVAESFEELLVTG